MKKSVLVSGPVLSCSGYGEQARFALRSLRTREDIFDIYVNPLTWGKTSWITADDEERDWIDGLIRKTHQRQQAMPNAPYDISVQVTIPPEFNKLAHVNIGYTAGIETTKVAPAWIEKANMMDKIIVPSTHSQNTFASTVYQLFNQQTEQHVGDLQVQTDFEVIPFPLRTTEPEELDINFETKFNFLTVSQISPRKNLETLVRNFVKEFKDDADVGLIVKASIANNSIYDRYNTTVALKKLLASTGLSDRKCKVYLLHGDLSEGQLATLYRHPKVKGYVTSTHGEGFGLPIYESAIAGLPVVATDWSSYLDFMTMPVKDKKGKVKDKKMFLKVQCEVKQVQQHAVWDGVIQADSKWAYVKEGSLRQKMRTLYKNPGTYRKNAKALQEHILENYKPEDLYAKFVNAVDNQNTDDQQSMNSWLDKLNGDVEEYE